MPRRAALVVLLLAAAGTAGWYFLLRPDPREEGLRLAAGNNFAAADPLLAAALARNPDDADAARALAVGRLAAGRFADAAGPLDRWTALRPDDPSAHLAKIEWAMQQNRPAEAIEPARAVLSLRPWTDALREQLAYWLYTTGRAEEADAEYARLRAKRDTPQLKLLHAETAYRVGAAARAARLADELLAAGPRSSFALTLRGAIHLDADEPAKALPLLREAVALPGEGQTRARHYLSLALARTGDEAGAKKVLAAEQRQQAVGMWEKYGRSESIGYKLAIAESLLATGQPAEAEKLLTAALTQDPNCPTVHRLFADLYAAAGRADKAAEHRLKAGPLKRKPTERRRR